MLANSPRPGDSTAIDLDLMDLDFTSTLSPGVRVEDTEELSRQREQRFVRAMKLLRRCSERYLSDLGQRAIQERLSKARDLGDILDTMDALSERLRQENDHATVTRLRVAILKIVSDDIVTSASWDA